MRIVSFMTQKGGSGKSTLAFNVAVAAAEAGETVALFDLDPQGMSDAWGKARLKLLRLAEEEEDEPRITRLSQPHVQSYPQDRLNELSAQLRALKGKGITLIILDTQGADSATQHLCMQVATLNVVPLRPSRADADMSRPTIYALRDGKKPFGFVLTQCLTVPGNTRAKDMAERLRSFGKLLEPLIFSRVEYQDSYSSGEGVTELKPNGKAAEEITTLWKSIKAASREI